MPILTCSMKRCFATIRREIGISFRFSEAERCCLCNQLDLPNEEGLAHFHLEGLDQHGLLKVGCQQSLDWISGLNWWTGLTFGAGNRKPRP